MTTEGDAASVASHIANLLAGLPEETVREWWTQAEHQLAELTTQEEGGEPGRVFSSSQAAATGKSTKSSYAKGKTKKDSCGSAEESGSTQPEFHYEEAFARNLGWVTEAEQATLRGKRVAIAGVGGVGGVHLLALTRLGIGAFHIADMDTFDLVNFNRQAGAMMSTLNRPKTEVMAEMARDINPELDIKIFGEGVNADNLGEFLEGVDLYVDGLDFFAFNARRETFKACHERNVPAVTAAPIGMGTAVLCFLPGKMSFEQYFRLDGCTTEPEMGLRFLLGLSPAGLHRRYLVDPSRIDLANHKGPSTSAACQLCAGVAATESVKILLGRGKVICAPRGYQFDAYRNKYVHTWRPGGNKNPIQRLALSIARRKLLGQGVNNRKIAESSSSSP